ncbi:SRPBCC family protein [Paenibacillus alkalitolerans]|uniref:SRPBCC family protein n=1 Tax=Paenibacillus alkalitolerans TaxID=2799335 RepID=UPI0018F48C22|nr:SRPBCC family protein [Paenibacillus alkalitolerans]
MVRIQLEILIKAPIEICFESARDIELHSKTVWKHTKERAIAGVTTGKIGEGQSVTFEAIHFGIKQKLTAKVVEYRRPYVFVDEMQQGAFKYMRHTHLFEESREGTVVKDILDFASPLGMLGRAFDLLVLERYMRAFVAYRQKKLKEFVESSMNNPRDFTDLM